MNQFQSLGEFLAAIRRRTWVIIPIFVLGCLAAAMFAKSQPKLYQAISVIQIQDARIEEPVRIGMPVRQQRDPARQVRLIEQQMMARDNLIEIMDRYDLFSDPNLSVIERVFEMRQSVFVEQIRAGAQPWQTDIPPSGLRITVQLGDPSKAAAVANDLMTSVIEQAREQGLAQARDALSFFDAEQERISTDIDKAAAEISAFKSANTDALPTAQTALRDQLATLEDTKLELDQEIVTLQNSTARQREGVVEQQVALLIQQRNVVETRISEIEEAMARSPEVERRLDALERDLAQLQEQYTIVTQRRSDAQMEQMLEAQQQSARMDVLEAAMVPEAPISTSALKIMVAGILGSGMLALGVAFVLELLNPAIRTAAQLERALGVKPVVSIPVITTKRDRRNNRWKWLGRIFALLLGLVAALVYVFGPEGLLGRILPMRAGN